MKNLNLLRGDFFFPGYVNAWYAPHFMHSSGLLHIFFNNKYNNNSIFQCNYNIHSTLKDVVSQ